MTPKLILKHGVKIVFLKITPKFYLKKWRENWIFKNGVKIEFLKMASKLDF